MLAALALAAAAGLGPWLPPLALAALHRAELVPLAGGWQWLAGTVALAVLALAWASDLVADALPATGHARERLKAVDAPLLGAVAVLAHVGAALPLAVALVTGAAGAALVHDASRRVRQVLAGNGHAPHRAAALREDAAALLLTGAAITLAPLAGLVALGLIGSAAVARARLTSAPSRRRPAR